jgi:hypothetical protein
MIRAVKAIAVERADAAAEIIERYRLIDCVDGLNFS